MGILFGQKSGILRHFVQNLLGVKVHASGKILKFCQPFGATKTHVSKLFRILFFFMWKDSYKFYQEKDQAELISFSYIGLT